MMSSSSGEKTDVGIAHFEDHRNGYRGFPDQLGYELTYSGKQPQKDVISSTKAVRLIERGIVEGPNAADNKLILGDNLGVLRTLMEDPKVRGKVRLVYIDPPYGTRLVFVSRDEESAYHDSLEGANYLEFLRKRLIFIRDLMADDGSIYVHLDNKMGFAAKVMMDELFGPKNFRNWITRKKSNPKNHTKRTYGNVQDFILFYSKSNNYIFNQPRTDRGIYTFEQRFPHTEAETDRRYALVPVHARGVRNGATGQPWRGKLPPSGKHWQLTPAKLDELDARGEIYWSPTGNPRRKIYADERPSGVPVQDIWLEFQDERNQMIETTGYPTEKNIDLLGRIVGASSEEGDLVMDCFAGSGTTLVAAGDQGRFWIVVDESNLAVSTTRKRLEESYAARQTQGRLPLVDESLEHKVAGYTFYETEPSLG